MIPETLWLVFSERWLEVSKAPADAIQWLERGFITTVPQGHLVGYAIAKTGYQLIVGE